MDIGIGYRDTGVSISPTSLNLGHNKYFRTVNYKILYYAFLDVRLVNNWEYKTHNARKIIDLAFN